MKYFLEQTNGANADIERHKKAGDKILLKKIYNLSKELREHPEASANAHCSVSFDTKK